jgi:tetratricopeptide (TPR) repeat protein
MALAFLLTAGCTPSGPNALLQGEQLIRVGRFPQAIAKLKIATAALPHHAQAWNHLGLAYHGARQYPEALAAYRQALFLDADLAAARFNLGSLLMEQNNPAAAVPEFTSYTILRPGAAAGWLSLGLAQFQARQTALGAPALNTALKLQPVNPEAWNALGLIASEKNKHSEALACFTSALRCQTNYAPALLNRAIVLHQYAKNHPLALQIYREYARLNPPPPNLSQVQDIIVQLEQEMAPVTSRMGAPLATSSNPAAVLKPGTNQAIPNTLATPIAGATAAARTNAGTNWVLAPNAPRKNLPPVAVSRTNVGPNLTLESPASRKTAAPTSFVKTNAAANPVLELSPPPTNATLAATASRTVTNLLTDSRKPEATAHAAPAVSVKNEVAVPSKEPIASEKPSPSVTFTQTVAEAAAGIHPPQAPRQAAARTIPGLATYPYRSPAVPPQGDRVKAVQLLKEGVQLQRDGHWNESVAAYQKASEADPAFFDAHNNLGMAAQAAGLLPQALLEYEIALAIDPASVNARYNFAIALQKANYPRDAALELERLLATRPADGRVHLLLANLYARELRQKTLARSHYRQILELDPQNDQAPAIRAWLAANP